MIQGHYHSLWSRPQNMVLCSFVPVAARMFSTGRVALGEKNHVLDQIHQPRCMSMCPRVDHAQRGRLHRGRELIEDDRHDRLLMIHDVPRRLTTVIPLSGSGGCTSPSAPTGAHNTKLAGTRIGSWARPRSAMRRRVESPGREGGAVKQARQDEGSS